MCAAGDLLLGCQEAAAAVSETFALQIARAAWVLGPSPYRGSPGRQDGCSGFVQVLGSSRGTWRRPHSLTRGRVAAVSEAGFFCAAYGASSLEFQRPRLVKHRSRAV